MGSVDDERRSTCSMTCSFFSSRGIVLRRAFAYPRVESGGQDASEWAGTLLGRPPPTICTPDQSCQTGSGYSYHPASQRASSQKLCGQVTVLFLAEVSEALGRRRRVGAASHGSLPFTRQMWGQLREGMMLSINEREDAVYWER